MSVRLIQSHINSLMKYHKTRYIFDFCFLVKSIYQGHCIISGSGRHGQVHNLSIVGFFSRPSKNISSCRPSYPLILALSFVIKYYCNSVLKYDWNTCWKCQVWKSGSIRFYQIEFSEAVCSSNILKDVDRYPHVREGVFSSGVPACLLHTLGLSRPVITYIGPIQVK